MKEKLLSIEQINQVKILYACEAGSRASGLSTKNSDYDVRFIYVHPLDWYLTIDQKRDVIELPITSSLDVTGWDLRKALFLLRKSNPPLLEWLHSEVSYLEYGAFRLELKNLARRAFSPKACIFHYLNMAKRNAKDIFNRESIKVKQLLSVLRPLLACKWIEHNGSFPSMDFPNLADNIVKHSKLRIQISQLISLKKEGHETIAVNDVSSIVPFINDELTHIEKYVQSLPGKRNDLTEELNKFFRRTLRNVWG